VDHTPDHGLDHIADHDVDQTTPIGDISTSSARNLGSTARLTGTLCADQTPLLTMPLWGLSTDVSAMNLEIGLT
jgi:hypothetical protein